MKGKWRDTETSLVLAYHASTFELPSAMFDEIYVCVLGQKLILKSCLFMLQSRIKVLWVFLGQNFTF